MKKDNRDNNNNNFNNDGNFGINEITSFYKNNKQVINGLGIAALAGFAVFSIVKWLPIQDIVSKIEDKFDEKFTDREFASNRQEREYAQ